MVKLVQQNFQDLWRAKLSRRVAAWVFLSLILVEAVILVPSYFNRRRELLLRKEQVSHELLEAAKQNHMEGGNLKLIFDRFAQQSLTSAVIKGGALYTSEGKLMSQFGEPIELRLSQLVGHDRFAKVTRDGQRYEVAWCGDNFNDEYILVIRHDASGLRLALLAYVGRIVLAVIIIAIVVTGSTLLVVSVTILAPFLQLRDDFGRVVEAIRKTDAEPCFTTLNAMQLKSQAREVEDEMTEVFRDFHQMFTRIYNEVQQRQQVESALREEQEKVNKLLLNVLPASIVDRLKEGEESIAEKFNSVTVLFADLVNFTCLSTQISPVELVELLNDVFSRFDELTAALHLEKIKTIGDAYMVVGGIPLVSSNHAQTIAHLALQMQEALAQFNVERQQNFQLRIGINTGPVVAGVIGRRKFAYDLWGDAVNVASRMESHGVPGKIQVTEASYLHLKDHYELEHRGKITVKGKGELDTYFLIGAKSPLPAVEQMD
ncbi:MAG: adenylate/guanylate cyclase domain-containing protein [Prochlorotrichaceae cyanobacterium]|jgi:class 3 adenylate cyclase